LLVLKECLGLIPKHFVEHGDGTEHPVDRPTFFPAGTAFAFGQYGVAVLCYDHTVGDLLTEDHVEWTPGEGKLEEWDEPGLFQKRLLAGLMSGSFSPTDFERVPSRVESERDMIRCFEWCLAMEGEKHQWPSLMGTYYDS
jgi:hypothetical protein